MKLNVRQMSQAVQSLSVQVLDALARSAVEAGRAMMRLGVTMKVTAARIQGEKQVEVAVAGLEGKMFVRAGMDPRYATEDDLNALCREIAGLTSLTAAERGRVMAAACAGWATRGTEPTGPSMRPAHRLWGSDRVQVA